MLFPSPSPAGPQQVRRRSGRAVAAALVCSACLAAPLALPADAGRAAPNLTIAQAQAALAALQTQEDAAVERFDAGTIALAAATAHARTATSRATAQRSVVEKDRRSLAAFAAAAYTSGGASGLPVLLTGSGGVGVALARAAAIDEIARMRSSRETALNAQQVELVGLEQQAGARQAAARTAQHELAGATARVKGLVAAEQGVLSRLQARARAELLAVQAAARAAAARAASAARADAARAVAAEQAAAARAARTAAADLVAASRSRAGGDRGPTSAGTQPTGQQLTGQAPPSAAGIAAVVLAAAFSQRGKPYVYGAAGPGSYDCSGLVMWAFAKAGIALPHSAAAQYGYGTHVPFSDLEPGDLVFYDDGDSIGHVGIYVGGGDMIDANHTGGWVDVRPLYSGLVGATRL